MNSTAEEVTAGAEALAEHRPVLSRQIGLLFPTACGCGADTAGWAKWEEHKTRAVLAAVLPAHDRRVKAETLAELIEAMEAMSLPTQVPPHLTRDWFEGYENADREFTDWLRRRLAAIMNGADDE